MCCAPNCDALAVSECLSDSLTDAANSINSAGAACGETADETKCCASNRDTCAVSERPSSSLTDAASQEEMAKNSPAINVNDCVTKSKVDNVYGCRHSRTEGIMRATNVMSGSKRALVCVLTEMSAGLRVKLRHMGSQ